MTSSIHSLGVGVIGCGSIGPVHAYSFQHLPGVRVLGVCDLQLARAERLGRELSVPHCTDYRQLLANPQIDIISIGTPHPIHAEIFQAAVQAGKAVVCEKPLASSVTDIDKMIQIATGAKRPTAGIFQHRTSPIIRQLKTLIDHGALGKLQRGQVKFRCQRDSSYFKADAWRGKAVEEGGGVFINQAIHFIDLLTYFLGHPLAVTGKIEHRWVPDIEVEDVGKAEVLYKNHIPATLDIANKQGADWKAEITVEGQKGSFTIGASHHLLSHQGLSAGAEADLQKASAIEKTLPMVPGKPEYGPWHLLQLSDFADACRTGRAPLISIAEAAVSNRLILGIYHSSQTGQAVDLTKPLPRQFSFQPMPVAFATEQLQPSAIRS